MGEQIEMTVEPYKKGDAIQVRGRGGTVLEATFESLEPHGRVAHLSFAMAGERKVRVEASDKLQAGEFTDRKMWLWRISDDVLERLRETHRAAEAARKAAHKEQRHG